MAAPTQILPSWLTLSTTVITDTNGDVFTSSTILRLPLTYYGPSIPLGTDSSLWTYGGLTSPPPTPSASLTLTQSPSPSATPSTTATLTAMPTSSVTSTPTSSAPLRSSSTLSSTSVSSSATTSAAPAASHGMSSSAITIVLGTLIGVLLLLSLVLLFFLLRRKYHRRSEDTPRELEGRTFWNRRTAFLSRRRTPIWTGWEVVRPEEGALSPGEGSPRGSGEEGDAFLTRHSMGGLSGPNEMAQTQTMSGTDTLVSMPVPTAAGQRSGASMRGHIIAPDVLLRMHAEDEPDSNRSYPDVRVVEPSPPQEQLSPLLPPPPLDPDGLGITGLTPSSRPISDRSLGSQKTVPQGSLGSEKSMGSLDTEQPERAELLTARRIKVGEMGQMAAAPPTQASSSRLGLQGLPARLTRLSWFKRMSLLGAAGLRASEEPDRFTRSPPRSHSRQGSRSRPGSWGQRSPELDVEAAAGSVPRSHSGLMAEMSRPMSSVSAKSASAKSGNTVYHDASSRPVSATLEFPMPVAMAPTSPTSPNSPQYPQQPERFTSSGTYLRIPTNDPPVYEEVSQLPPLPPRSPARATAPEVDILDMPAPRPTSPFAAASRTQLPPGLPPVPDVWRGSYQDNRASAGSSPISIDILEDEPPAARDGWRSLAGESSGNSGNIGRRTTFGVPMVIHQRDTQSSEQGSFHSTHLSPRSPLSPAGSAGHTLTGSGSSRPSMFSNVRSGSAVSLAPSTSSSSEDHRRVATSESIGSPPLSAVHTGEHFETPLSSPLPPHTGAHALSPIQASPASSRQPLVEGTGTLTSSGTARTEASHRSSVTTTLTDPITGVVMHFPGLPYQSERERDQRDYRRGDRGYDNQNMGW